jgi:hypothetical protein
MDNLSGLSDDAREIITLARNILHREAVRIEGSGHPGKGDNPYREAVYAMNRTGAPLRK